MTRLLVRISDAAEAAAAATAGADIVELRVDGLGAAESAMARAVRAAFSGTLRFSLSDGAADARILRDALALGADETVVRDAAPLFSRGGPGERSGSPALVVRLTIGVDGAETVPRLRGRADQVTIESGVAERVFDRAGISQLADLAEACRAADLPFGFAGGLEAPDIPRLLMLKPDVLGFDAAVRGGHRQDGVLLPHAIEAIRDLIPREDGQSRSIDGTRVRDTIFVRDFIVLLSIGAYQAEEKARQRVRFSVEAVVERRVGPPRDMRDVFSYDVILETIRVLAERSHVAFVETLAEEVAAALLTHADIRHVTVQVEKLDIVDGAVGIRIARAAEAR